MNILLVMADVLIVYTLLMLTIFLLSSKDDIGDKSVFMFNALPGEEKKALLQKLEQ